MIGTHSPDKPSSAHRCRHTGDVERYARRRDGVWARRVVHTDSVIDDVFAAVRGLVDAGEYRDELPGVPGTGLDGAPVSALQSMLRVAADVRARVTGAPRRARGRVGRVPAAALPASLEAVKECEALVGHRLPPLLRRPYLEVGNGGFGPGYGASACVVDTATTQARPPWTSTARGVRRGQSAREPSCRSVTGDAQFTRSSNAPSPRD